MPPSSKPGTPSPYLSHPIPGTKSNLEVCIRMLRGIKGVCGRMIAVTVMIPSPDNRLPQKEN